VNMPPNATNVVVYIADWQMNDSDRWFPVSWNGYKGYVRQKFVTPQ